MYHDEVMDEAGASKPKVPLDEEWAVLAKKMLKGADPEKKLTWRTAEVSCTSSVSSALFRACHVTSCTVVWYYSLFTRPLLIAIIGAHIMLETFISRGQNHT